MSDYEVKEGDIALFVNDKEGNDNRPDLTGYAMIGGEKKDVSVWAKDSGKLRFSGKVQEPYNGGGRNASNGVSQGNSSVLKLNYHDGDTVEMLFDSKLHSYKVGDEIIPSATKVLDIISKPALIPWALKVGANWLEKNFFFDEDASSNKTKVYKSRMAIEPLIKGMKSAYRSKSYDAINIGNITHNWVEEAINWKLEGGEIPKMPKQEEAVNSIEAFKDWVSQNVVEWKSSEEKLFNRKYRYAGTVDARAIINGEYCVIDWKTSKAVYPEYHLQVAAYAKAVEDIHGIPVDATYILRCDKATGRFEAVRSTAIEENFQAFLAALTLHRRMKELR